MRWYLTKLNPTPLDLIQCIKYFTYPISPYKVTVPVWQCILEELTLQKFDVCVRMYVLFYVCVWLDFCRFDWRKGLHVALHEVTWCMVVHRTRRDGSSFMWHQPRQRCKYTTSVDIQKRAIKSYSLVQNHMRAQRVCSRAENSAI